MRLFDESAIVTFVVEKESDVGIYAIAKKVAADMEMVSGRRPGIVEDCSKASGDIVLFAQLGKSPILKQLELTGRIDAKSVRGKREVYGIRLLKEEQLADIKIGNHCSQALVIYGSDKRGTIYGMFHLSELMGVSPLVFWGDAPVQHKERMELDASVEMISKEPSVKYRGFFINDEWPCFGTWAFHHFGGFNADMYDKVFELLLRLKGNYLWPAMWTSCFALDGPGEESARLADKYGVIMGNSHHEPCLRAGEEWDIYKGENGSYGSEWNYMINKEGLLKYWEDGLKRSCKYENIITVGMRGERDSKLEGPGSLQENIDILKDIITEQKKLIQANIRPGEKGFPMLLAIYKEVEQYYYGCGETAGLKDWDGLQDIILMFCEDNFGHMRYLPEKEASHQGGYGMYYHLDYHGAPISYEWINSTPLTAIWEQMTLAYEQGVRTVWMVNVGDLKGNEFPLSYFMELAYDFETWGSSAPNSTRTFTRLWLQKQFGGLVTAAQIDCMELLLTKGTAWIGKCRPEALKSDTYRQADGEADRVLEAICELEQRLQKLEKELAVEAKEGFYSMIYNQLKMGFNLIQMQISAGKNAHYASLGKKAANIWADRVRECIEADRQLVCTAGSRNNGKWHGMWTGSHVGFVKWNEDGCRYPLRTYVTPFERPRMVVSRVGGDRILCKNYGEPDSMEILDFLYEGISDVWIEIANSGEGIFVCEVEAQKVGGSGMETCGWLTWELTCAQVEYQELLHIHCCREKLPKQEEICRVQITEKDAVVYLNVHGKRTGLETAKKEIQSGAAGRTHTEYCGRICIPADGFFKADLLSSHGTLGLLVLEDFGFYGIGLKAFPFQTEYEEALAPKAVYSIYVQEAGDYILTLYLAPSNPVSPKRQWYLSAGVTSQGQIKQGEEAGQSTEWRRLQLFPEDYRAGEADCRMWAEGVISQIHTVETRLRLRQGFNQVSIRFHDGVAVLERLVLERIVEDRP